MERLDASAKDVMKGKYILVILGDITRGIVPTNLEACIWPLGIRRMNRTFAPMVNLMCELMVTKEVIMSF
jgi:hypothetical protein